MRLLLVSTGPHIRDSIPLPFLTTFFLLYNSYDFKNSKLRKFYNISLPREYASELDKARDERPVRLAEEWWTREAARYDQLETESAAAREAELAALGEERLAVGARVKEMAVEVDAVSATSGPVMSADSGPEG
jgi:hypothetical protein